MNKLFHGVDVNQLLKIQGRKGYGVSLALAKGEELETFCSGSGRFGQDFPVNPDMLFQAASISKPMFAMTVLRYVDKGIIDLDADISGVVSDFVKGPLSFSALLSHTAGINVHGFPGYRADHAPLTLEDVIAGRGNTPKIRRIKPYGKQCMYSGGGITLAELAFTRFTGMTLRDAFQKEIAEPLGLIRTCTPSSRWMRNWSQTPPLPAGTHTGKIPRTAITITRSMQRRECGQRRQN